MSTKDDLAVLPIHLKWRLINPADGSPIQTVASVGTVEVGAVVMVGSTFTALCYLPFGRGEGKAMSSLGKDEAMAWLEARVNEWDARWTVARG